jgi:hypothetical protein
MTIAPSKANPELVIDPNRVLPGPVVVKGMQLVARRHFEIVEFGSYIDHLQLSLSNRAQICGRDLRAFSRLPKLKSLCIGE